MAHVIHTFSHLLFHAPPRHTAERLSILIPLWCVGRQFPRSLSASRHMWLVKDNLVATCGFGTVKPLVSNLSQLISGMGFINRRDTYGNPNW